jgi:hypothetical protein
VESFRLSPSLSKPIAKYLKCVVECIHSYVNKRANAKKAPAETIVVYLNYLYRVQFITGNRFLVGIFADTQTYMHKKLAIMYVHHSIDNAL